MGLNNLISAAGLFILMLIAWSISSNKKNINWRIITWGLIFQIVFAFFIFTVPAGHKVFMFINSIVVQVMDCAAAGSKFLFSRLALPPGTTNEFGETSLGFILAFQAFPTIIFFSALVSILYYFNIMQKIIKFFSYIFTKSMKISGAESLCASSNIFVGIESSLTIKPYINEMTRSELCTILTSGMATVASNVLALYIFALNKNFPTIAGHLISASFLSAPAAIIMSKLIIPEDDTPQTLGENIKVEYEKEDNLFEAIINASMAGVKLIVGIVSLLIAVIGLVTLFDLAFSSLGSYLNSLAGLSIDWSFKSILGYIFYPLTLIIGIPLADAPLISKIIGERLILTEVTSYMDLSFAIKNNLLKDPRSIVITAYALCGFAHIPSMAIFTGGISAIAPKKKSTIAKLSIRALIAATLACLMTACIAGIFYTNGSIILM